MDKIKFFRVLWRLNAIIILVFSIVLIIFFIISLAQGVNKSYQTDSVYLPDDDDKKYERKETWYLGELQKTGKSGIFIVPLIFEQSFFIDISKEKYTEAIRNYLIVNTNLNNSFWLFENNNFVLSEAQYLIQKKIISGIISSYIFSQSDVLALYFVIYKKDTNQDNAIKSNDLATVALTKPDGSFYTEIETNIDKIQDFEVSNSGQDLILFYEKNSKKYISKYSLAEFKKLADIEIDSVKNTEFKNTRNHRFY